MNEEYLKGYFNTYVLPKKQDATYDDWIGKIKNNEQYKQGMFYTHVLPKKQDATYDDWNTKVFGGDLTGATASGKVVPKTETATTTTTTTPKTGYSENITNFVTLYQKDPTAAMQLLPTISEEEIKATPLNSMVKESILKAKKNLELSNTFKEPILQAGVMRGVEVKAKQKEKDVPTLSFASIYKEAEKQKEDITIPYSSQEQTVTPLPKEDILKANLTLINSYLSKGDVDSYNTALKMTKIQAEKYPYLKSYANRLESYIKREEGDFEGAAKSYDNIEDDSKTISDFNISAYTKVKAGKVEEANEDIDKAIEIGNPSDINDIDDLIYSWQLKGNMAYNAGSTELMEQASSKIKELKYAKDRATKDNVFTIFTKTPLTQEEWDKQYNIVQKNIITSPILGAAEAAGMALQGVYEMSTPPPKDKVYTKEEYDKEKNDRVLLGYSKALNGMVSTAFNTFPSIYAFNIGIGAIGGIEKEVRNKQLEDLQKYTNMPMEALEKAKEEEGVTDTVSKWIFAPLTSILKETGVYDKMNETQRNFAGLGDVVTTILGLSLAHKGVSSLKKNIPPAIEDYIRSEDKFSTDKGIQEFRKGEAKVEATAEKIKNIDIDKATLDAIMEMKKEAEPIVAVMDKINKGEPITEAEGKLVVDFIDQTMKDPEFIIKTFKKEPIQVEKKVDNSVQGNLNRLRTEEANIVNKKEYAGIDDLYRAEEIGNEIAALNEKVNKVIAEKTKAVQEQIDLLKEERNSLYEKEGISNEELLVNSEIEADINTRLQPLLKEKQNIINEVYELDITELDSILKLKEETKPITIEEQIKSTEDIVKGEGSTLNETNTVEDNINRLNKEISDIVDKGDNIGIIELNKAEALEKELATLQEKVKLAVVEKAKPINEQIELLRQERDALYQEEGLSGTDIYKRSEIEADINSRLAPLLKERQRIANEINYSDISVLDEILKPKEEAKPITIDEQIAKTEDIINKDGVTDLTEGGTKQKIEGVIDEVKQDVIDGEEKKITETTEKQVEEIPLTKTTYNFESVKQENIDRYDYYTKEVDGVTKYFKKEKSAVTPIEVGKKEAVTKPIEGKLELNTNVKNVDIKDVNTDIKRFQNRKGKYSEQSVKNITENYDENKFDPIVSWKDPKDGKIYVLSGHSRLEALKRIGKEKIPTRIFEGTEAQAKQYAIDSNVLGTQETLTERANKYSKMREEGKTEVEIDKEADIEGANKQRVIDYSYLNKKGKTIASLKAFEESGVSENVDNIQKVAQWIGGARRIFKELTNAHENEMYDYLINKNKIGTKEGQISNKTQFFDLINKRINGLEEFKSNEPLNFEHRVGKGTLELEVSKEIKDLKAQQTKISADIKKAQKTIKDKELRDKTISNLTKEFLDVNKKIGDAEKKLEIAKEGDKKQISIFDELNKEVENGTITKETIERFEQRTENEVAKSESTIEALESKEKVATEKESIEKLESEVDKEITKVTEQQPTTPATTPKAEVGTTTIPTIDNTTTPPITTKGEPITITPPTKTTPTPATTAKAEVGTTTTPTTTPKVDVVKKSSTEIAKGIKPKDEFISKLNDTKEIVKAKVKAFEEKYGLRAKGADGVSKAGLGLDDIIDAGFKAVELAYKAEKGVKEAIDKLITDVKGSDFYKALTKEQQKEFETDLREDVKTIAHEVIKEQETTTTELSGIKHADTAKDRSSLGMEEYEGGLEITEKEAVIKAKKWIADGGDVRTIIDKLKNNKNLELYESAVIGEYKNSLSERIAKNPTPELLKEHADLIELTDKSGTSWSETGLGRKLMSPKVDNLANFLFDRSKDKGYELTPEQIKEETTAYNELKKKIEELEVAMKLEQDKVARLEAEKELKKIKSKTTKTTKKTHADYVNERKDILSKMREDLRKSASVTYLTLPYLPQLKAIAPHVKLLVESYAKEGLGKLDDIITAIHNEIKDDIVGITKNDINDIISGAYNETKTRSQKLNQIRMIEKEASLLKELANARKNIEKKPLSKKGKENERILELQKKIKEVRKHNKNLEQTIDAPPLDKGLKTDKERIADREKFLLKKQQQLISDIKSGNYAKEPLPKPKVKYSRRVLDLMDDVNNLKRTIKIKRLADQQNKQAGSTVIKIGKELLAVKRLGQTAIDLSIMFRQLARVTLNLRYFNQTANNFKAQLSTVFSPKKFARLMDEIHRDKDYHDMVEDNIIFNDLNTGITKNINEEYPRSILLKTKYIKEPFLSSNRAADAPLNYARFQLYKSKKAMLEKQGIFRDTDPQAYKDMGNWVMNMTSRGKLLKILENTQASTILGNTFYGVRLMASQINTLNPKNYIDIKALNPLSNKKLKDYDAVKLDAVKDMVGFTSGVILTGAAAVAAGAKVSFDPNDPDFLQVRFGDKVYDITGGLSAYVRTTMRIMEAIGLRAESEVTGKNKGEADRASKFAWESTTRFFRNKLAPNTSSVVNLFYGKNTVGEEFNYKEFLEVYPMYADDFIKAMKEDGISSVATVLIPNLIGIGYGSYANKANRAFMGSDAEIQYQKQQQAKLEKKNPKLKDERMRKANIEKLRKELGEKAIPDNMTLDETKKKLKELNYTTQMKIYNEGIEQGLDMEKPKEPTETTKSGGSKSTKGKGKLSKSKKSKK